MKIAVFSFLILVTSIRLASSQDITDRVQEMRKFGDQEQTRQQQQQYQQYLKNNDSENGVSQRTGPTGSLDKGGGSVGYKWSTK